MRLATREEGDVVVRGTFVTYDRLGLSYEPTDVITIRDFDLVVTAKVTAIERSTGKVLFERDFAGRSTVRAGTDLTSAERQALPLLAQDLARNIAVALIEGTW